MTHKYRTCAALCVTIAAALVTSAPCIAQNFAERDAREIGSFVLTEAGLAKYTQAVKNLGAHASRMRDACGDDDSESARSLDQMAARLDAIPEVKTAVRSAGLTTREYLVFSLSLFQNGMAAWALTQPGGKLPPGTSMANVNFYRAHEAAIRQLGEQTKGSDCDSEAGDSEDGSEGDSED